MKILIFKYKKIASVILLLGIFTSCTADLDRFPTNGTTNDELFSTIDGYKQEMATVYSTLSYDYFFRQYWNIQEIPTDEAVVTWDDPQGSFSYNQLKWNADNSSVNDVYSATMYNITLCNNFILESSPELLSKRGFAESDIVTITTYVAEVRFLRAYFYWIMLDLYGNPPFATETTLANSEVPLQISQADLFAFIESELIAIDSDLVDSRDNEYGRADKATAWSLLARLYLNAETYTGTPRYTEAITYSSKIINSGYTLELDYNWLMLGDNYQNTNEFIFTANYDNAKFETWGGTNYLALGAANVPAELNGMSSSWGSLRMTPSIPNLFPTHDTSVDGRGAFWTDGQTLEIDVLGNSSQGYSTYKFRNLDRAGNSITQENVYNNLGDIDFPIFRLAEIYLIYAESVLRGGTGGDAGTALGYINKIRGRAYATDPNSIEGNIISSELTLDFILDERARELYWETHRRTDLIRYNRFTTGDYLWSWKGGVKEGKSVNEIYNLFPLPTSDILANPNLTQNSGY